MRFQYPFLKILLSLLLSLGAQSIAQQTSQSNAEWRATPDINCDSRQENCFKKSISLIKANFKSYERQTKSAAGEKFFWETLGNVSWKGDFLGVSRYLLEEKPTDYVFVLIHGLYGDETQFRGLAFHLHQQRQNVLHLVLPGHGADWQRAPRIQAREWTTEVQRAVTLARPLGKKLIVMGQSTGGLLALIQAILSPGSVDGLILMEPALRVQEKMTAIACGAKIFTNFAHDSPRLAKLLGYDVEKIPKSVSPHMGCVVSNMRGELLESLKLNPENSGQATQFHEMPDRNREEEEVLQNSQRLASFISVPTLVMNISDDTVVKPEDIRSFADGLKQQNIGSYFEHSPQTAFHGNFQYHKPAVFYKMIDSFLAERFDLNAIKKKNEISDDSKLAFEFLRGFLELLKKHESEIQQSKQQSLYLLFLRFDIFYLRPSETNAKYLHFSGQNFAKMNSEIDSYLENEERLAWSLIKDKVVDNMKAYFNTTSNMRDQSHVARKHQILMQLSQELNRFEIRNALEVMGKSSFLSP